MQAAIIYFTAIAFCFFCLDTKETKDQGKTNGSARFAGPAPPEQYTSKKSFHTLYRVSIVFKNSNQFNYH
jgi:hypothetical protein